MSSSLEWVTEEFNGSEITETCKTQGLTVWLRHGNGKGYVSCAEVGLNDQEIPGGPKMREQAVSLATSRVGEVPAEFEGLF